VFSYSAVHDENKCSELCRHLRKKPAPDLVIPENPVKIQWLTFQLHSTYEIDKEKEIIESNLFV